MTIKERLYALLMNFFLALRYPGDKKNEPGGSSRMARFPKTMYFPFKN